MQQRVVDLQLGDEGGPGDLAGLLIPAPLSSHVGHLSASGPHVMHMHMQCCTGWVHSVMLFNKTRQESECTIIAAVDDAQNVPAATAIFALASRGCGCVCCCSCCHHCCCLAVDKTCFLPLTCCCCCGHCCFWLCHDVNMCCRCCACAGGGGHAMMEFTGRLQAAFPCCTCHTSDDMVATGLFARLVRACTPGGCWVQRSAATSVD